MEKMKILFFASAFLTAYSYAVYPLILAFLSLFIRKEAAVSRIKPGVTLIISAYNEEGAIAKKIENSLSLDYPKDSIEIIVVSDGSTDKTNDIVKGYGTAGVVLLSNPVRRGKTAGLNDAVAAARGDVIVFSDADSMYEPQAVNKMVSLLGSPGIGLVTGSTRYTSGGHAGVQETSGIYTRLERCIKRLESSVGSCVGADGAIFAMRRPLYKQLMGDDINDLVIPLGVVKQGYRVVFHDGLLCTEESSSDSAAEFRRQIRITNRTLRALFRHLELKNFFRYPLFSFELISHKLIRLSVPFFLLLLIFFNALLIGEGLAYKLIFAGQAVFYATAFIGFIQERMGKKGRFSSFIYHFAMVNISMLLGWVKYLSGEKHVTWGLQRQ